MDIKLDYHEQRIVLNLLKKYLSKKDVSFSINQVSNFDLYYLLMLYHKLQSAIDERAEADAYTD